MVLRLCWRAVNIDPVASYALPRWYQILDVRLHRGIDCIGSGRVIAVQVLGAVVHQVFGVTSDPEG